MKILHIEPYLIATRPDMPYVNTQFVTRTMNMLRAAQGQTVRQPLWERFRHLPKAAVIALAIAALTLVSGAAYAVYTFWIKPIVTTGDIRQNQYGRTEVSLNVSDCLQLKEKAIFEIKQGSAIPATETAAVVQARCEVQAIENWAYRAFTNVEQGPGSIDGQIMTSVGTFESLNGNNLTLLEEGGAKTEKAFDSNTLFIDQAQTAKPDDFKKGDSVMVVTLAHYKPEGGWPTSTEVKAIVKVSLPAKYYDHERQNTVAQRSGCVGNPDDSCLMEGAGIDIYPHNEGSSDLPRPQGNNLKMIQGRLVGHDGANFTIKGSSGAIYTITAPRDVLTEFNVQHSPNYQGTQIVPGDSLTVRYAQVDGADSKKIASGDIVYIGLDLEVINKQDGIKKY